MINYFTNEKIATETDFTPYPLIKLAAPSFSSNSVLKSCFFLSADESLENKIVSSLNLASSLRKIRTIPVITTTDPRVMLIYSKYKNQLSQNLSLGEENGLLLKKIDDVEKDIDDLQKAWAEEKSSLLEEIGIIQSQKKDLEMKIKTLETFANDSAAQKTLENEKMKLKNISSEEINKLKIELGTESEKKYDELSLDYSALNGEYESLKNKYKDVIKLVTLGESRIRELESQLASSIDRLDNGGILIKKLEEMLVEYQAKILNINKSWKSQGNDINSFNQERESLNEMIESLKQQLSESENFFQDKIKLLESNNKNISSKLLSESEEFIKLQEMVSQLTSLNEKSSAKLMKQVSINSELEEKVENLEIELKAAKKSLGFEKIRVQSLSNNQDNVSDLEFEKEQLQKDRDGLQRTVKTLRGLLENSSEREIDLRNQNEELMDRLDKERSNSLSLLKELQDKKFDSDLNSYSMQLEKSRNRSSNSFPSSISKSPLVQSPKNGKPFVNILSPQSSSSKSSNSLITELEDQRALPKKQNISEIVGLNHNNNNKSKDFNFLEIESHSPILGNKHKILQPRVPNKTISDFDESTISNTESNVRNLKKVSTSEISKDSTDSESQSVPARETRPKISQKVKKPPAKSSKKSSIVSNFIHSSDSGVNGGRASRKKAPISYVESPIPKLGNRINSASGGLKDINTIEPSSHSDPSQIMEGLPSNSDLDSSVKDLSSPKAFKSGNVKPKPKPKPKTKPKPKSKTNVDSSEAKSDAQSSQTIPDEINKPEDVTSKNSGSKKLKVSLSKVVPAKKKANSDKSRNQPNDLEKSDNGSDSSINLNGGIKRKRLISNRFPGQLNLISSESDYSPSGTFGNSENETKKPKKRISLARASRALGIDSSDLDLDPDSSFEDSRRKFSFDKAKFKLPPINLTVLPKK
ncbi:hypothetical protein AYI68_g8049 [Smittium mucronatum]|uniref:Uncharacterized protein n=1 Tax=Smittium mucronatum TaxID=133383 RepID=A0A1R0GM09_9FUNG|nr:hypothetical protein AYI68_g8049 [Smittium mucronatum]